jgi:integral membrane protein (TIGR00529 family)
VQIEVIGVVVSFVLVLVLIARGLGIVTSLIAGIIAAGIFLPLSAAELITLILNEVLNPTVVHLVITVFLISGWGNGMKAGGDIDRVVKSFAALFRDDRLLCMLMPALFGTLNVHGGAIMSAPLVEKSGRSLGLSNERMSAINVFFRHVGYFIYPLYSSIIIMEELTGVRRLVIIRNNLFVMLVGLATAYLVFFGDVRSNRTQSAEETGIKEHVLNFLLGFSPIVTMLALTSILGIPLYLGALVGTMILVWKNQPDARSGQAWIQTLKTFFTEWVDYKVPLTVIAVMGFKGIIQESGAVVSILDAMVGNGISLPFLVMGSGLVVSFGIGMHVAATALLAPVLVVLYPAEAIGPFVSLLFTSIIVGYIASPLHLCLVLSNRYFRADTGRVYRRLVWPLLAMLLAALIRAYLLQ